MPIPNRSSVVIAIGVCTSALLVSCGTNTTGNPNPTTTTPATTTTVAEPTPAALDKFYSQKPEWGSCKDFETESEPLDSDLECTHITVPLDYDQPDGKTARIAVSKLAATGKRIGSLLFNPGGPGASGLALASQGSGTELADRFDGIGFDPRGIGASTPAVVCLTPSEADAERDDLDIDMTPAGIAQTEKEEQDYAAKCAERTGIDVLSHLGTREVVRDMDVIRAALGDDKMNFVGYSYGTRIGAAYAEAFPTRVRAMVLDGAVDPQQDPIQEVLKQGAGFQMAFDAYAADCAQSKSCPLGTDPSQAVEKFRALVDPLIAKHAETTDARGLGYNDAMTGVLQAMYSQELWRVLTTGLNELQDHRGDVLLQLADTYDGRRDDGTYSNLNDAFNAIRCVDDPKITDRQALGTADIKHRQVAPFLDDGRGTGQAPLDQCAFWPVPNTSDPHTISVPGVANIVVVSTTEDPATPYQAGVDLARQLGGSLITYNGTQHTVALGSGVACVDDAVVAYLSDLTPPAPGLTC